jgi:hypothetical protein
MNLRSRRAVCRRCGGAGGVVCRPPIRKGEGAGIRNDISKTLPPFCKPMACGIFETLRRRGCLKRLAGRTFGASSSTCTNCTRPRSQGRCSNVSTSSMPSSKGFAVALPTSAAQCDKNAADRLGYAEWSCNRQLNVFVTSRMVWFAERASGLPSLGAACERPARPRQYGRSGQTQNDVPKALVLLLTPNDRRCAAALRAAVLLRDRP